MNQEQMIPGVAQVQPTYAPQPATAPMQPVQMEVPIQQPAVAKPFSLNLEKFTKANVYELLAGIAEGKSNIAFNSDESLRAFGQMVEMNFKPQAGGGKSNNPSHVDPATGLMVHWCRFLKVYMPEVDMVMSGGKSKGASKLASKHNYELGKQATAWKEKALVLFGNQDYVGGAEANEKAKTIELSRSNVASYSPEVLAAYLPKPKEEAVPEVAAPVAPPMVGQPVMQPAVNPVQMAPQAPVQPPMLDANGFPVQQVAPVGVHPAYNA